MRVCVLASGSKGNVTYIETTRHKILLDLGTNVRYITKKLQEIGVDIKEIDTIVISHVHSDHIGALNLYIKKYTATVYMTNLMVSELETGCAISKYSHLVFFDEDIYLDSTKINVFKTSHDTKDSKSFVVSEGDSSVVYLTDTGYLNQKYFPLLSNRSVYLFESNHDVELLLNGKYPSWLKDRIIGPYGHLSNKDAAVYLAKLVGVNTKKIILMHLSHENNNEEIALGTIHDIFKEYDISFSDICCARQNEKSEEIIL